MQERNEFLEADGLFGEVENQEWFNDHSNTQYAQDPGVQGVSLPNIMCFIVRDKTTGHYDRVVMDTKENVAVYSSTSLEAIASYIDKLKIIKHFEDA